MGQQTAIKTSFHLPDGREVTLETGKLAAQADGSVLLRCGDMMLLATAVSAREMKEGQSFFPLSVDYQEKFASAGRIPGNFFRRETRLSDYEILISRLADRVIRPLFPDNYMNETQIMVSLLSCDSDTLPDAFVGLAASAALIASDIPMEQPISEVRVARINGEFVINPGREALKLADIEIMVGATAHDILMVEGEMQECQEDELVAAILLGKEEIKRHCEVQLRLAELAGKTEKRAVAETIENEEVKALVAQYCSEGYLKTASAGLGKHERKAGFKATEDEMKTVLTELKGEEWMLENKHFISRYTYKLQKHVIREMMLNQQIRLDGRKTTEIRNIWAEIDYLPTTHGSAVFTRGETQALGSLTLGTKLDEQMIDNPLDFHFNKFILHYNFPAFSTGEVKPNRGPSRREVGHANLARRSLMQVMPKDYPYTVRIVSDILESNGSSSMATVCAGSLALHDGGVPIKSHVSGIAMGLIKDGDRSAILSDILGDEDHLGDMDFKVTGTPNGICAVQMDMKIDGLPEALLRQALAQAREGRLHILGKMNEVIAKPADDLKPHAPRMITLEIDASFIGAVIGPGGKIIQEMQKETGAVIQIEEVGKKGVVTISSANKESIDAAKAKILSIAFLPSVGDEYEGTVAQMQPYGAFIDFLPNKSGLLHISEIAWERLATMEETGLKEGDKIKIKLVEYDEKTGKFRLSHKVLLPKPEGYVERPPREDRPARSNSDRPRNDRPPRR